MQRLLIRASIVLVLLLFSLGTSDAGASPVAVTGVWFQQSKLTASDGAADDGLGNSVALAADGMTAIAGAPATTINSHQAQGAAYVYVRSGTTWTQQAKLVADDGGTFDNFGFAVAMSADGNTALIGANGATVNGHAYQGAAYVYTRSGVTWTKQIKLVGNDSTDADAFGTSVALSSDGNTALVSAFNAAVSGHTQQGSAYVFTRNDTSWSQQAKLVSIDGAVSDQFGTSVALSSSGNTSVIGAYGADVGGHSNQGAAYIFTRSVTTWTQAKKLVSNDGAAIDNFGSSTGLSGDGQTAFVGAPMATVNEGAEGAAYIFGYSAGDWIQQAKLVASDGGIADAFGTSVALNGDGSLALASAYNAEVNGNSQQGAAYIYSRSGTTWTQQSKLTASDGAASDAFGTAGALTSDGKFVLIGASFANVASHSGQGAAYIFIPAQEIYVPLVVR